MGDLIKVNFKKTPKSFEYDQDRAAEAYDNYRRNIDNHDAATIRFYRTFVGLIVVFWILVLFKLI